VQTDATPAGGPVLEVRITGYDVYGNLIRSPAVTLEPNLHTAPLLSVTWCPQPFTLITKIEYKLADSISTDRLHIGMLWQLDFAKNEASAGIVSADNAEYFLVPRQGIALPGEFSFVAANTIGTGYGDGTTPHKSFEILCVQARNLDALGTDDTATLTPVAAATGGYSWGSSAGTGDVAYPKNKLWIIGTPAGGSNPIFADKVVPNTHVIPVVTAYDLATSADTHLLAITYRSAYRILSSIGGANYPEQH
jgi:hypothetical protein